MVSFSLFTDHLLPEFWVSKTQKPWVLGWDPLVTQCPNLLINESFFLKDISLLNFYFLKFLKSFFIMLC